MSITISAGSFRRHGKFAVDRVRTARTGRRRSARLAALREQKTEKTESFKDEGEPETTLTARVKQESTE